MTESFLKMLIPMELFRNELTELYVSEMVSENKERFEKNAHILKE
jgi:uncharacterized protein YqgQ